MSTGVKKAELLAPAGDMEKLRYAVAFGADAVYLSGQRFGMRAAAGNFDEQQLFEAVEYCHARGVRVFVTINVMPRPHDLEELPRHIDVVAASGADAVIVADIGVLAMVKRRAPKMHIHVSTQANVLNQAAACEWHRMGASRIVLARELSLSEIAHIRRSVPQELELEVFAHGSMCMAYSGRCVLSNYMTGRDANRGACAQPCRWKYHLVEEKRPGQYFPVSESDEGTFILSAQDLCMVEYIPQLLEAGVDSFKLEGRAKTFYYTAVVTNAYRRALDAAQNGLPLPQQAAEELLKVSHREYSTGFYFEQARQQYRDGYIREWDVCACVMSCTPEGHALLQQKNKCTPGERVELLIPGQDAHSFTLGQMYSTEGELLDCAKHPMMLFESKMPVYAPPFSLIRKKIQ